MALDADVLGSFAWTERTGGVLEPRERRALLRPLLRGHRGIVAGQVARLLRVNSGRRAVVDLSCLAAPDSVLAREAEDAARDLLSPAVLNHSHRAFAWGAAVAALEDREFDAELLYVAALFHDAGIATPDRDVDFTVRSAAHARAFLEGRDGPDPGTVADAITLHHTPGVGPELGTEAYLLSSGAAVDVFGLRAGELPPAVLGAVVDRFPRAGFKREFPALWRAEARSVPHGRAWFLRRYALSDVTIRMAPFRG